MSFAGIRPILHTPFGPGPEAPVALDELAALVPALAAHGVDGVVALGLASEAWTLTEEERDASVEAAAAAAATAGLALTVGIEGATRVAVGRAERAAARGAASLMVLPPPRARPEGVLAHYAAVAAVGLPVLVQDSPQVTGVELPAALLAELGERAERARWVKVEGPAAGPKVSALVEAGLGVVAGWGGLHYPESLRRGAAGLMPGADLAPAFVALHAAWRRGEPELALGLYRDLLPYLAYCAQSLELLVVAAKRALVTAGVFGSARLRDGAGELDAVQAATLDLLLAELPPVAGGEAVVRR